MKAKRAHTWWWPSTSRRSTCGYPWPICTHCGLVRLKNDATEKLVRAGCLGAQHEDQQ